MHEPTLCTAVSVLESGVRFLAQPDLYKLADCFAP